MVSWNRNKSFRRLSVAALAIMMYVALPVLAQAQNQIPTAEFFNSLSPQQISGYFTQLNPQQLQGFFAQMDQGALTSVLGKLGDEGVKAVVGQLPPEVVQGFIDNMSPETYMGFVAGIKDPELLMSLGFEDAAERDGFILDNLDAIDPALADVLYGQLILATDGEDLEAAILETAGVSNTIDYLLSLDEDARGVLLSTLDARELNELAVELTDLTDFLVGVDSDAIAEALDELSAEDAANYLVAIDPKELSAVLEEMDSLSQLQNILEGHASELAALGIDTSTLDESITELEDAQEMLAEAYDLGYEEMEAAGGEGGTGEEGSTDEEGGTGAEEGTDEEGSTGEEEGTSEAVEGTEEGTGEGE